MACAVEHEQASKAGAAGNMEPSYTEVASGRSSCRIGIGRTTFGVQGVTPAVIVATSLRGATSYMFVFLVSS